MAYEALINQAKEYLKLDNSEFEEYYRKAAENLQNSYDQSLSLLKKQYVKDKNEAAAQSMLNKRNMDQYLAARGLSRSGESVQEQINSNISLNNTFNSLADTNARQMTELAKSKNADLLSLEEKRLERKNANEKWTTEQAFNVAKAENAKIEREEDIAREAQLLAEERAYQDAVRQQSYAQQMAMLNAEQAFKQRSAIEAREYETMKIASQREYEDAVRRTEYELEAQIRAEKARTEAEKAAKDQEYKLEYYRLQQADRERLLAEERAYEERQKKADREYDEAQKLSDRKYSEAQKEAERKYAEAQKALEQANKERLLAEEREYNDRVRAQENQWKAEEEARELKAKNEYYKMQQADKERLIAEERAYNEGKKDNNSSPSDESKTDEGSLNSSEKSYIQNMTKNVISTATGGKSSISTANEKVAAYNLLKELKSKGTPSKYMKAIEYNLASAGYTAPDDTEIYETALVERLGEIYDMAYDDTVKMLSEKNVNSIAARPQAIQRARDSQLTYLYKHCSSLDAFYEIASKIGISYDRAYSFISSHKMN